MKDEAFVDKNTSYVVGELQKYIDDNNISSMEMHKVDDWVRKKRAISLIIFDNSRVIYDSTLIRPFDVQGDDDDPFHKGKDSKGQRKIYELKFNDKTLDAMMIIFFGYRFGDIAAYVKIIVSSGVFSILLILLVKRKTDYINQLAEEISILEGGDLDYSITIKGVDEITYLARNIEDMRKAFIERIKNEKEVINASYSLVTAMSHDLRTPLTVLMGYMDILDTNKNISDEDKRLFISKSRKKAYQIKQLSDKIFEYFLAVAPDDDKMEKEYYTTDVINEMAEDYIFTLNEKGYDVDYKNTAENVKVYIDVQLIHRVFDNVFSNILKYADKSCKILIQTETYDDKLKFSAKNYINKNNENVESSNIGIEVCRRIMSRHDGVFDIFDDGECFEAVIIFKTE
jgi:signal transduction histidine kinase